MKKIRRKYNCKDVTMLLAAKTIAQYFKDNIKDLSIVNQKWTIEYADELILRIDNILNQILGIYAKKDLKDATINLVVLMDKVKQDLAKFKRFVNVCFKDDPAQKDYVFSLLGFNQHYLSASRGNQDAFINLLFAFKTNFSDDLRTTLVNYGMPEIIIDDIIVSANNVDQANNSQERNKLLSKEISFNRRTVLNDIYDEVIKICILAHPFYKELPAKREMFTFAKITRRIIKKQKVENQINGLDNDKKNDDNSHIDNVDDINQ